MSEPILAAPSPLEGSGGAAGSGCSPGTSALPDGVWFGFVREVQASAVDFDLACIFFDEAATTAAAADGQAEPPNGFYIRNENAQLREIKVSPEGAQVHVIVAPPDAELRPEVADLTNFTTLENTYTAAALCPGEFCGMWIYINDSVVTEIMEQYLP